MHFNDFELQILAKYRIEDLRNMAGARRMSNRRPHIRIALAHGLIAVANQIWREETTQAEPAPRKVALT